MIFSQTPNGKHQITSKSQIAITKDLNFLEFGIWNLEFDFRGASL